MASRKWGSRSVATTCPPEPTWLQSQEAIEPCPPAISRQCQFLATPTSRKFRIVHGSHTSSSSVRRSRAAFHLLSRAYWYADNLSTSPVIKSDPHIVH